MKIKITTRTSALLFDSIKRASRGVSLAVVAAGFFFASHPAFAADTPTVEWIGTTSTAWATTTNWSPSVLPSSGTSALFDSSFSNQPVMSANQTAQGIWLKTGVGQDVVITATTGRTLTITGNATLSGQANAGIIMDDSANHNLTLGTNVTTAIGNDTGFYVNNSGTLTLINMNPNAHVLTLGGTSTSGFTVVTAWSSTVSVGSVVVNTAGSVSFAGSNSGFTGGVNLTAGTLYVNSARALGSAASVFTINGGTLDSANGTSVLNANPITLGGNFTFGGTTNLTLAASPITNAGNRTITLNGSAKTLTMSGTMTNTSGANQTTTINGAGNTFSFGGYALSDSATNYSNVIDGSGNVTITGTVGNGASSASGLAYAGTGTLMLSASNSFSGGLTVKSGTVMGGNNANANFGAGTITLGDTAGSASAALFGGFSTGGVSNAIVLATNSNANLTIGTTGISGLFTFSGGMTGTNNITVTANGSNGTGGAVFSTNPTNIVGTITNASLGSGTTTFSGGVGSNVTTITENSTTSTLGITTNALSVNSAGTTLVNSNPSGTKTLTVSGGVNGTGNLVLNNNSGVSNGITLSGNDINMTGTLTNSGNGNGGTLISSVIGSNVAAVNQNSATSSLTLSNGTNTYSGTVTANAGTLIISGSLAGTVNVKTGATLAGAGSIGGQTTTFSSGVGSGNNGHVAPGNVASAGILTVNNTVGLANNTFLDFNLNVSGTTAGTNGNDLLKVQGTTGANGDLTIGTGVTLNVTTGISFGEGVYHLITYTGTLTDNSSAFTDWSVTGLLGGESGSFVIGANSIDLLVVPEPGSLVMLLGGAGMLGAWQRSRRRRG